MEDDQNVDDDFDFSHIDERIHALGQYQKEFQKICPQNLRFTAYGSFLPTTQWSTSIWSHSGTPEKCLNNRSLDLPLGNAPRNSTLNARPDSAATDLSLPELKNSSVYSLPESWNTGVCVSSHEPLQSSIDQSDKKSLKFRVKFGSDDILTYNNAAIYSNLGLEMSPLSASDGSPTGWGGVSPESLGEQVKSPSYMIKSMEQIMTSFPVPNGALLSPLDDSLIGLTEERNLLDGSRSGPTQQRFPVFRNEVASQVHGKKAPGEKKVKFGEKNRRFVELKNGGYEDPFNPVDAVLKREGKIKPSTSKETISDNLKLPPKSNELGNGLSGMVSEANMGMAKDRFVSPNLFKKGTFGELASRTDDKQNAEDSSAGMFLKVKKIGCDLVNDGKGDRSLDLFEENCGVPKGSKVCDRGMLAPAKQNCERKTPQQRGVEMSHGKERSLSLGEKKSERSQYSDTTATRNSEQSFRVSSFPGSKDTITYKNCFQFKSRADDKLHKDLRKVSETIPNKKPMEKECASVGLGIPVKGQKKNPKLEGSKQKLDTFSDKPKRRSGKAHAKDSNPEESGKISSAFWYQSKDTSGKDELNDNKFEVSGKGSLAIGNKSKKTSGKSVARDFRPEVYEKESYRFSKKPKERSGNEENDSFSEAHLKGHLKDATTLPCPRPEEVTPVLIEDNWVCCDKCQQWRLLPHGANLYDLPEEWDCSMLNWLPGMNSCSFSEEETKNALNALYQVPVSEMQHNQQTNPVGTTSGGTLVEARHLNQNNQDLCFTAVPRGGKKKLGANADQRSSCTDVLNLKQTNQQGPVRSKDLKNLSKSSQEPKWERRSVTRPLKTKSRRQPGLDGVISFKKAKTQSTGCTDIDQNHAGLSTEEVETDIPTYNEPRDGSLPSVKQSKKQFYETIASEGHDKSSITGKKRKLKELQGFQIQTDNLPSSTHHVKNGQVSLEKTSGRECRKEKKIRESKCQEKETCTSMASGKPDKKDEVSRILCSSGKSNPLDGSGLCKSGRSLKNRPLEGLDGHNFSEWTADGNISSRRDLEVGQACAADISGSSMISEDTIRPKGGKSDARQNLLQNQNSEKPSKWEHSDGGGSDFSVLPADGSDGGDSTKVSQHVGKDDCENGFHHVSSRHPTGERHGIRDTVSTSHRRQHDSSHSANCALKEAEDLKHSVDNLKISGSGLKSTKLGFQAALNFLHWASLLGPCNRNSAKYGDMTSTAAYSNSAKLFEWFAHQYERRNDMASAALAYKCLEVAYMQIIYSNHLIVSSDRHELDMSLQMVSPVESPSSSASDVDNLNNLSMVDKMDVVKDGISLQTTGDHVIAARNHPNLVRLLNFTQDANLAMEASRKSQIAFAAAETRLSVKGNEEAISSIRRVLNFSFHDVEELLRLVSLSMEALSSR